MVSPRKMIRRRPREKWLALIPHHHPGYIDWDQFERIQQMLSQNIILPQGAWPGAAKRGPALLVGLLALPTLWTQAERVLHGTLPQRDALPLLPGVFSTTSSSGASTSAAWTWSGLWPESLLRVVQPAAVEAALQASVEATCQQDESTSRPWSVTCRRLVIKRSGQRSNTTWPIPRTAWWPMSWNAAGTWRSIALPSLNIVSPRSEITMHG